MKNTGAIMKICSKFHNVNSQVKIEISGTGQIWSWNSAFPGIYAPLAWCNITHKKRRET